MHNNNSLFLIKKFKNGIHCNTVFLEVKTSQHFIKHNNISQNIKTFSGKASIFQEAPHLDRHYNITEKHNDF